MFDHLQDLRCEVGDDDVRPGPPHAHQDLHQGGLQVDGPGGRRVVQHGELPGDLVDEHGVVRETCLRLPHDVQVGEARLHHQHVGPLRHVSLGSSVSQTSASTRQLVALESWFSFSEIKQFSYFSVTEGWRGLGGVPEGSVEAGGELDRVAED